MQLVLASDPRQTRVGARWPDGTITDAVIYNRIGDRVHGAYQHQADSDRWDVFDRLMGELSVVLPPFPALIPAPPEMEEVEVVCYIPVLNGGALGSPQKEMPVAPHVAVAEWITLRGTRKVPKPAQEPVVLEGKIIDGYWESQTNLKVRLDSNWSSNNGTYLGRRCTLTIHPEEK